jgi:single-strand DNA-binding protein
MADSTVTLVGNLTREPELRFTQSGQAIATLGIAVSRRYQQNGEWQEKTSFFNVTAWGQLGENAASSLAKGSRAIVTGRLEQRSYETQDGEKRSVVEVVADEIGPSLRWATAQVDRNDRREGGGQGSGSGGGQASGSAGAQASSSGSASGGGRQQYDDPSGEEPF